MILSQNRKFLLSFIGLLLLQIALLAQESVPVQRSTNKVILEGTVYYIHTVKPGETLYAISRAYNVSQKDISLENPGVISGIQIGQALKIPADPGPQKEIDTSELAGSSGAVTMHTVQAGETLYGIARQYQLKPRDIQKLNPGVTARNLKPGQTLTVPEVLVIDEDHSYNEEGLIYHEVKRKETLYSIAGYYHVTMDEIRDLNPELGWGGPKAGQVIRIPEPQLAENNELEEAPVTEEEAEELSWYPETEEYTYDEFDERNENIRRSYQIAFFIPFDFREMEPLDSLIKDVESETRKNRIIERYMMEEKIPQSVQFLEFFQGTLLAIDSMRLAGMRLDVRYYDTRRSLDRTRDILRIRELQNFDLILGPFHDYTLELVSEFARQHRIPVVTPFHDGYDLIENNPYLFQLSPSLEREYREAASLVASKHMYNIVYVRQQDSLDLEKHEYFKQLIFDRFDDYHPSDPVVFKEVVQELDRADELIYSLSLDKKNLVVVPTADEALASSVVSALFYQLNRYDIEVLGTPYWTEFSSIDFTYYHKLKLMFYNSFWVDYHDPKVDEFMARFRKHYINEPTITSKKGINYGILGYDMTFYFLNALRTRGRRFILELEDYNPELVQGPFSFERISGVGGYENSHIGFYRFYPDMSIQKFDLPPLPARHYYFRPLENPMRRTYLYKEEENN